MRMVRASRANFLSGTKKERAGCTFLLQIDYKDYRSVVVDGRPTTVQTLLSTAPV